MTNIHSTRTGIAHLPLHQGKAPRWLFQRMTKLAREITLILAEEYGPGEITQRLSDPFWFQALGCVLGYDWHSSGVTTVVCGALKEGVKGLEHELGLFIAGGKGRASRRTPAQIEEAGPALQVDPASLVYASRMAAKVDTSALQDGYQLYHHTFFFTACGNWAVVQQGMNESNRYARRYHWLGEKVADFVSEPHAAICSQTRGKVLNLVAWESTPARDTIAKIVTEEKPEKISAELSHLKTLDLPSRHSIELRDINPKRLDRILLSSYERHPENFEALLGLEGVGPKTIRALSLVAELVYGIPISHQDPARYSFAHGGKDGIPYPVDRETYDGTIEYLSRVVNRTRMGEEEKRQSLSRLRLLHTRTTA
ncbi:DUF763 domain-containing protein [Chloroflexota bacterium]